MKQKMSISVDEEKIKLLEKYIQKGTFRNKSHALEQGIDKLLQMLEGTLGVERPAGGLHE